MTQLPQETSVHCATCGQNLTGVAIGGTCPECGALVAPSFKGSGVATSGKATASLVLGILSIVATPGGCMCVGITSVGGVVLGALAIVFSRLATGDVRAGRAHPSSLSSAKAGMICGIIGLVLGLAVILLIVGAFLVQSARQMTIPATPPAVPATPVPMLPVP